MTESHTDRLESALAGRYKIERKLGEGGMASVYLAEDVKHERRVALKVLRPELAAVVGAERFLAEIKTTANLQHPHILPLFDSGEADSFLFYVMPYVEGESLRDKLDREKQLPVDEAVRITSDVAEALHSAHRQGVIHRDVKPANILLSEGRPLVADFGIALAVGAGGSRRLTETGLSLGTPYYMSPEQATGDQEVGPATDIYALAAVLYEILTGDPPYVGSTAQAVLGKIIQGLPVSATAIRRSVPSNVDAAIRKALEKLPADRFTSAQDFTRALADPGYRYGDVAVTGGRTPAGPWNGLSIALATTTLVLGGMVGWLLLRPGPPAVVAQYSIELPAGQGLSGIPRTNNLAVDPGGAWFVYRGEAAANGQLLLRRHDQLEATPLVDAELPGPGNPSASPDGTKVAFTSGSTRGAQLMVATIGGGPPATIVDSLDVRGGTGSRSAVSWADDGYLYFDHGPGGAGISRVPEDGGPVEVVTTSESEAGGAAHIAPHALPSGSGVLFELLYPDGKRDVAVHDLSAGEHTILVSGARGPRYSPTGHLLYVSEQGALIAAPFDPTTLTMTGDATAVFDGVKIGPRGRTDVAVGADGTLMYVRGGWEAALDEMVWVTRDGAVSAIDPEWPHGDYSDPAVSPSGQQLALTVTRDNTSEIWMKQLPRGRLSQFTSEGGQRAAWSGDGRTLAFWSNRDGAYRVYQRRSDGSAPAELVPVLEPTSRPGQVVYSAGGDWMVVESEEDLYAVRLDAAGTPEGEVRALRTTDDLEVHPALSPDGRWLAYMLAPRFTVTVCPFPICDVTYSVATDGATLPIWAHDGRELFYRTGQGSLAVVDVPPGPTFDWGEERILFDLRAFVGDWPHPFDLAPDDERFAMVQWPEELDSAAQLIVVRNFFQLLEGLFR